MRKWRYGDQDIICICGQKQTMLHLLVCPSGPSPCTQEGLMMSNQKAKNVAQYWARENI